MSKPFETTEKFLLNAVSECISGMSALNMPAEPLPDEITAPIIKEKGYIFLSESDKMIKHSVEHFRAVCENFRLAEKQLCHVDAMLWQLMKKYASNQELFDELHEILQEMEKI